MKKYNIRKFLLSLIIILIIGSFSSIASAHYDTAYWHEMKQASTNMEWMSQLRGNVTLAELAIPGTHDSMAYRSDLMFIDNTRTQTMDLEQQLNSGIRYIDIRAKYTDNGFPLHHGIVYLGYDFEDVLNTIKKFLNNHPQEAIIMRFKQENSSASDLQMKKVFDSYYRKYETLFWKPNGDNNPTLDSIRGKIVLLSDVLSLNIYGLNYRDVDVQDYYNLDTNWDLYSKWLKIKSHALKVSFNKSKLSLNHLSAGSAGVMPYFVASGHSSPQTGAPRLLTGLTEPAYSSYYPEFPRISQAGELSSIAFEGMNTMYADLLERKVVKYTGIVAADFPGERLIKAIIKYNDYLIDNDEMGRYKIITSINTEMSLDNNLKSNGQISLWKSNSQNNQQWDLVYNNIKKAYQIVSVADGKVLTWSDDNGSNKVIVANNEQKENQYWKLEDYQTLGYLIRSNKNTNMILGYNGAAVNGAEISVGAMTLDKSFFILKKIQN